MRGKKVASTAITTMFSTTVVNTNVQPQFQSVKSRPFITLPIHISQENQCGSQQRKRKQAEKREHFISDRRKPIYLFIRQVSYRANTGLVLAYHIYNLQHAS